MGRKKYIKDSEQLFPFGLGNAQPVFAYVNHGERLAAELGLTPIYLRYNSGLHVSQNGRELALQLEQLLGHWPVPVEEVSVLAHSMGGLVMRSAAHYAQQDGLALAEKAQEPRFSRYAAPRRAAGACRQHRRQFADRAVRCL